MLQIITAFYSSDRQNRILIKGGYFFTIYLDIIYYRKREIREFKRKDRELQKSGTEETSGKTTQAGVHATSHVNSISKVSIPAVLPGLKSDAERREMSIVSYNHLAFCISLYIWGIGNELLRFVKNSRKRCLQPFSVVF